MRWVVPSPFLPFLSNHCCVRRRTPPLASVKERETGAFYFPLRGGGDRGARVCSLRPTSSEKGKKKRKKKFSSSLSHIIPVSLFLETEPTPVGRSVCWAVAFRAVIPFSPSLASAESPSRRLFLPRGGVVARGGAPPLSLSFPLFCVSPARGRVGKAYNFFSPPFPPRPPLFLFFVSVCSSYLPPPPPSVSLKFLFFPPPPPFSFYVSRSFQAPFSQRGSLFFSESPRQDIDQAANFHSFLPLSPSPPFFFFFFFSFPGTAFFAGAWTSNKEREEEEGREEEGGTFSQSCLVEAPGGETGVELVW